MPGKKADKAVKPGDAAVDDPKMAQTPIFSPDDLDLDIPETSQVCHREGCDEPMTQRLVVDGAHVPLCEAHADAVLLEIFES